jgi:hypothetical protein
LEKINTSAWENNTSIWENNTSAQEITAGADSHLETVKKMHAR